MCEVYKIFAGGFGVLDFSEKAMQEMFEYESNGVGDISIDGFNTIGKKVNGYAVGKKWCDVQISAWLEDFKKNRLFARLSLQEMYWNKEFPEWWLDRIFMIPEFENMVKNIKEL